MSRCIYSEIVKITHTHSKNGRETLSDARPKRKIKIAISEYLENNYIKANRTWPPPKLKKFERHYIDNSGILKSPHLCQEQGRVSLLTQL